MTRDVGRPHLTAETALVRTLGCHYHRASVQSLLLAILGLALLAAPGRAQFGHPLKGSWIGDWGPANGDRTRVLLVLDWNGKTISGTLNPGPNAAQLSKATLDPSTWTVQFEAERKDPGGRVVRSTISGKLENLGAYQRVMTGTWTEDGRKGVFRLVRN